MGEGEGHIIGQCTLFHILTIFFFSFSRYLATGDSYRSIAFHFRVGISTVAGIVRSVCEAIWDCLVEDFMPVQSEAEWRKIAEDFKTMWAFPNCVGAMDGKHVIIEAPPCSGSLYYNYKGTFSIVLLAVVDAHCCFRVVDMGASGKSSDGGTLAASAFGSAQQQGTLNLPGDAPLPGAEHLGPMPHVFLADEAFPLRRNLLRPYPGHTVGEKRVFNYRLSHARRLVECAFGILATQWRIYRRVLGVSPQVAESAVKATVVLHNFLRWGDGAPTGAPTGPAEPSAGIQDVARVGSNNASREAIAVRNQFTEYFSSAAGQVPWQNHL